MKPKCYFCDSELTVVAHYYKVGLKEEPVCEECFAKTINRRRAKEQEENG